MQAFGQLANSTSTTSGDFFWQLNFADWFGIIFGIAAFAIGIVIVWLQIRTERKFRKFRASIVANNLAGIRSLLNSDADHLNWINEQLDKNKDGDRRGILEHLFEGVGRSFEVTADTVKRDADFLRMNIPTDLYDKLIVASIQIRYNYPEPVDWNASEEEYMHNWFTETKKTLDLIKEVDVEITEILNKNIE